ncbi:MAG: cytochrome c [Myxococcota bacterium]|nr:cytochrome c [Myxococcota bacterium]
MKRFWPALALVSGILALSVLQAAPELGLFDLRQQTRAALGAGRLGLGVGLIVLMAQWAGLKVPRVLMVGLPAAVLATVVIVALRPPLPQVQLQAMPLGEGSYQQLCADCHGPLGSGGMAPALDDGEWLVGGGTRAELDAAIGTRHDLPFDELLAPEQREALLDYLLSLQPPT